MQAELTNYRQSPRKVRLVANLVRGKTVAEANQQLTFLPKRASLPILKLIRSAVANTANGREVKLAEDQLLIKDIRVDEGATLKRYRPRARGSAYRINKRTSRVKVVLVEKKPAAPVKKPRTKSKAVSKK